MENDIIVGIKSLALDMINEAKSGHSGIVLSSAPIVYTLFANHLNISLNDPTWINRDRFILSAGHGSALLYSVLHLAGFKISIDDLKKFRKFGSITPGHPEYGLTPGVDMTTGPLGQGLATAVGMALGSKILYSKYIIPRKNALSLDSHVIDYKVYVLCSDGDLMEGISYEAASFAGTMKLNNLIVLYDSNGVSLDGKTNQTFSENVLERFKAAGWNTIEVKKGNDVKAIDKAISSAKNSSKPTIIEFKTILGEGLSCEGSNLAHGKVLSDSELIAFKAKYGLPKDKFYVSDTIKNKFMAQIANHSSPKYTVWAKVYENYVSNYLDGDYSEFNYLFDKKVNYNILNRNWKFDKNSRQSTRIINHDIINEISNIVPNLVGGSADVGHSTMTILDSQLFIYSGNYNGKNIPFGVREHAMGAIVNGLALVKFIPFCSTFLSFSDYMKPSIRLAAISKIPSIFIFSHDSVNIGEDGPTHQPIEQLSALRSIPNLNVYRPCDANELLGCWDIILNTKDKPSALILSRKDTELLPTTRSDLINRGAYIVFQPNNNFNAILVATGSEVQTCVYIANDLWKTKQYSIRVVSMPCMEKYLEQSSDYKLGLLPKNVKTFVVEAGSKFGWGSIASDENKLITIDKFGVSASSNDALKYCNFDYEQIKERIIKQL